MDPKGYYSILGVSTTSNYIQIRRAYRDLALKYHPDRNNSSMAIEMMKKINEAYGVLSDKQKRFDYDHGKDVLTNSIKNAYDIHTKYSNYRDNERWTNSKSKSDSYSYYNEGYYNFDGQRKHGYSKYRELSVWWQMLFSLIPIINFWTFFRIQRLEMAISSLFPIFVGINILLVLMSEYPFFPLRYGDRLFLFLLLFSCALVFFNRRWTIKWNEQIKKGQIPSGDEIDKKVKLITQLVLSVIPFINFAAFARIYCFQRSLVIGIPTYILMVFVVNALLDNSSSLFYPVYFTLTSIVFIVFMYKWTIRFNLGKYSK